MTDDMIALADRVVACKGWRWMPGMRASLSSGLVVRLGDHDEGSLWCAMLAGGATCTVDVRHPSYTVAPDLTDPATLGCILALVRKAHGAPFLQVSVSISREHGYRFECAPRHRGAWVESEEKALVAALEAAP